MIKRLVKLTFEEDQVETFLQLFEKRRPLIEQFPGCIHVEMWRPIHPTNVFFTFSRWDNEEALEAYRRSDFFRSTWKVTKALLSEKPEAWSFPE